MLPITLAVLLSFLLAPLVGLLRHAHLPRVPGRSAVRGRRAGRGAGLGRADRHAARESGQRPAAIPANRRDQAANHPDAHRRPPGRAARPGGWPGSARHIAGATDGRQGCGGQQASDGGGATAAAVAAADRRGGARPHPGAAGHRRHRVHRRGVRAAAARRLARPADPALRLQRPAPDHRGTGRCRAPVEPLFPHPVGHQCRLRLRRWRRAAGHWGAEPSALGCAWRVAALRAPMSAPGFRRSSQSRWLLPWTRGGAWPPGRSCSTPWSSCSWAR